MSATLSWKLNRLKAMSAGEVCWRARQAVGIVLGRIKPFGPPAVPAPDIRRASRPWLRIAHAQHASACLDAADRIAAGRFDVFALRNIELGSPPRWNRDPRTGTEAPLTFGKSLDYRDARQVGDIKYLWEPNRHLHLVTLAQACDFSGDARYFEVIRAHLESWFDSCPYPQGPNWASALEAGIRLINWSVTWQILGGPGSPLFEGAEGTRFRRRWLDSVYQHCEFVEANFSRYSSANNHVIGEAAGLFIAAVTWPYWARSRDWAEAARALLEQEAVAQNAADGVNLEQAVSYQQFVLDLLVLALLAGRAHGVSFSEAYRERIEAMLEFVASIMDVAGNVPMIGDADDAVVLRLDHGPAFCNYRSLLATGALLFRRGDFKAKAGGLDDKTRGLMGETADVDFNGIDAAGAVLPVKRGFPSGGYYVLGCDFETAREIRLIVDAGPLGYGAIAAHGHADALAFTLSLGGLEFLVDPGTYAYHTQAPWRQYFRGTGAHNTARVDGVDQSQSGGNFLWLRKARAQRSVWQSTGEQEIFEGWHDGYTSRPDPVIHRRRITLDKRARRIVIEDRFEMAGAHDVELLLHCDERCRVERAEDGYRIAREGRALAIRLPQAAGAACRVFCGSTAPIAGWVSRRFDEKQPAATIAWQTRLTGNAVLCTEIECR
jgi:hypothetical protein